MSGTMKSLAHSRWECKSHVVFIPKYRRKAIYGEIRQLLGEIFHDLARQKECRSLKDTCWRIMSICVARFRPNMPWPR
jgi:REP-associated tyrosine transposase